MNLKQDILTEARLLGFFLAGFTTPEPPPHLDEFHRWLALGRHGDMKYMTDPRREDPRRLLPGCRSILVLGIRYPDPQASPGKPSGQDTAIRQPWAGKVAAYAWGKDYHLVLPERMEALVNFIERQVGHAVPHAVYTDSAPLLERDLAQRAGLGWIGKNTCLIHPKAGSYFFLAEILLALEIEADAPFAFDRCGTCSRCLEACPTQAILPDRTIDARRCISYLTIENKGSLPPDLRPKMGAWVFGCDICQMVCPWNRSRTGEVDPLFQSLPGSRVAGRVDVDDLSITAQEFREAYRDSPLLRAKRRGILRNLAVALGNTGGKEAIPALEKANENEEEDSLVREHAQWALEQLRSR